MKRNYYGILCVSLAILSAAIATIAGQVAQTQTTNDAVAAAQKTRNTAATRPEQSKTAHDLSPVFSAAEAKPVSDVSELQPGKGKISGFDFYRDPLNAEQPNLNPIAIVRKES